MIAPTIADACNILSLFGISASVSDVTILEKSVKPNKVRIICCINTDFKRKYVCRISNELNYPKELIEKQCEFAMYLYDNNIDTAKKYSYNGEYCRTLKLESGCFLVTLEDWIGKDRVLVTPEEYRMLGCLLGKMHSLSEKFTLKVGEGLISRSIITGRASFNNLLRQMNNPIHDSSVIERTAYKHDSLISTLRENLHKLPSGTVHGDLSSFNNIVSIPYQNNIVIIDFNLAGEEPYLFDVLVTFYSSINNLFQSSDDVLIENYYTFFEGYSSVRKFNDVELRLWACAAALFDGLYFSKRMIRKYNLSNKADNDTWLYKAAEHFI